MGKSTAAFVAAEQSWGDGSVASHHNVALAAFSGRCAASSAAAAAHAASLLGASPDRLADIVFDVVVHALAAPCRTAPLPGAGARRRRQRRRGRRVGRNVSSEERYFIATPGWSEDGADAKLATTGIDNGFGDVSNISTAVVSNFFYCS